MDPIELLKADHQLIRELFTFSRRAATADERFAIFSHIRRELETHARIEETIFYPAFAQFETFEGLLDDSYEDHQNIQDLLEATALVEPAELEDPMFELEDAVEAHLEEEEKEFFPHVRDVLNESELERLGDMLLDGRRGMQRIAA